MNEIVKEFWDNLSISSEDIDTIKTTLRELYLYDE